MWVQTEDGSLVNLDHFEKVELRRMSTSADTKVRVCAVREGEVNGNWETIATLPTKDHAEMIVAGIMQAIRTGAKGYIVPVQE